MPLWRRPAPNRIELHGSMMTLAVRIQGGFGSVGSGLSRGWIAAPGSRPVHAFESLFAGALRPVEASPKTVLGRSSRREEARNGLERRLRAVSPHFFIARARDRPVVPNVHFHPMFIGQSEASDLPGARRCREPRAPKRENNVGIKCSFDLHWKHSVCNGESKHNC